MRFLNFTALVLGCAASLAAAPAINGVVNAASWLPPSLPNSGIAQGGMFTVTGSGLGPSTLQAAQGYPLPTAAGLAGTSIQVKVGGVTETCPMLYTYAGQVAAVLPSATPIGSGTLTLTYQGASSTFDIQVVTASFGIFALNEDGSGPGVFTDLSYNVITMTNAAHPGDNLVIWGSGLGAITGSDAEPPPVGQQLDSGQVKVLIGNQLVTPLYAGRSGSPAEDQINFTVPEGIAPGCKTTLAVVVKGVTGNVTTIPIAPEGQATCGDTFNALTTANLQAAVSSGSLNLAGVELAHVAGHDDTLAAAFVTFPTDSLIRSFGGTTSPSIGNCIAYETYASTLNVTDPIQPTLLHTGNELTLTGPAGTKNAPSLATGTYGDILASSAPFYLEPGNYTVTNGAGGSNVDAFTWDLTLPPSVVATIPASIDRAKDLTLTWTGGSAFPFVTIFGYSAVPSASGNFSWVEFICTADASAGSFTIPSAILELLPTDGYGSLEQRGVSLQIAGVAENHFTVAGSPGINEGFFTAFIATGAVATVE